MVHTNWLVSEKKDSWRAVGIPSIYFFGDVIRVGLEDTTARQDPTGAACTVSCKLLD